MKAWMNCSDNKEHLLNGVPDRRSNIERTVIVGGRELSVQQAENSEELTISGTVNSYYQKQMALKLIFEENSHRTIIDRISVDRKPPVLKGTGHDQ